MNLKTPCHHCGQNIAFAFLLTLATCAAVTSADQLLVLGGKVHRRADLAAASASKLQSLGIDYISGRVMQSVLGGFLVSLDDLATRERFDTVFVEKVGQFVDGDKVAWFAVENGVLEYKTILGATKTVRKFAPALKPTDDQVKKFQTLEKLDEKAAAEAYEKAAKAAALEEDRMRAELKAKADAKAAGVAEAARAKQYAADAKVTAAYQRRAEAGDAEAQYEVGLRCLDGKGIEKSVAKAREWLQKAASQSHSKAKAKLAELAEKTH